MSKEQYDFRGFPEREGVQPRLALRPTEAAKTLGVSERKLWSLTHDCSSDPIPIVRLGRVTLYPVDALRNWLERNIVGHRKEPEDGKHRT